MNSSTTGDVSLYESYMKAAFPAKTEEKVVESVEQIDEASTAFDKFFQELQNTVRKSGGTQQDKLVDSLVAWAVKFPKSYKKANSSSNPIAAELFEAILMGADATPSELQEL